MSKTDYIFIETDTNAILTRLISVYEEMTGRTLLPADPDRLFIAWIANAISQERVNLNYVGNQNIPSRAAGENLDAIGQWIYGVVRKPAQPSKCTVRFYISEAQETSILIPRGTRVTDTSKTIYWATTEDVFVAIGSTYADVPVECLTLGVAGNGYAEGQINNLVDIDNVLFYTRCENITMSAGGADEQSDEEYFESLRNSIDARNTAGSQGAYVYWARSVSNAIADVRAIRPTENHEETATVFTHGSDKVAFIGGDFISENTVKVFVNGTAADESEYSVSYENGLVTIALSGSLASQTVITVKYVQDDAGKVNIYALMDDGNIAGEAIKELILEACNAENVRPLTDYVTVEDAEYTSFDIDFTFYIDRNSERSISEIQSAVNKSVDDYVIWQTAKIGRDINPSKLLSMLMATGVKRIELRSPSFATIEDGTLGVPHVAKKGTVNIVNGGYEDE